MGHRLSSGSNGSERRVPLKLGKEDGDEGKLGRVVGGGGVRTLSDF